MGAGQMEDTLSHLSYEDYTWLLDRDNVANVDMTLATLHNAAIIHAVPERIVGPYYGSLPEGSLALLIQEPSESVDTLRCRVFSKQGNGIDVFRGVFSVDFRNDVFFTGAYSLKSEFFAKLTMGCAENGHPGAAEDEQRGKGPGGRENKPALVCISWDCKFCRARGELTCKCAPQMSRRESERTRNYRYHYTRQIVANSSRNIWDAYWANFGALIGQYSGFRSSLVALGANVNVYRSGGLFEDFRRYVSSIVTSDLAMRISKTTSPVALLEDDKGAKHSCTECSAVFHRHYDLVRHVRAVHRKLKMFSCEYCSKTFTQRGHLNEHIHAIHMESNAVCETCGMKFSARSKLLRHTRVVHLQVKTHKCDGCGKLFSESSNLRRHLLHVHGKAVSPSRYENELPLKQRKRQVQTSP
mmetsp:Transcript_3350/g.10202  ORF Transcript_3350/g.10202 Transcript_3350/m.10202 type:complete len:413 (-) Transcript_3350:72-1310(-)